MSAPPVDGGYLQPMTPYKTGKKAVEKFAGFDFLRAIFAVAILMLHVELLVPLSTIGLGFLNDIFNANFAYLGVPVFLQISLFLFYIKTFQAESGGYFLRKRLPRLIYLYLFWVPTLLVFNLVFGFNGGWELVQTAISSPRALIEFIISGGNTPLYFFFSLIFLTVTCWLFASLLVFIKSAAVRRVLSYLLLGLSCLLLLAFFRLSLIEDSENSIIRFLSNFAKWNYNPLNFLPYVFITAIAADDFLAGRLAKVTPTLKFLLLGLSTLFLMFTIGEWLLSQELLHYSRPSLVFGSWLLLYLALLSKRAVPPIIQFLSSCSLGIYTFHLFFTHGFFTKAGMELPPIFDFLKVLVKFAVALAASIALTLVFRRNRFLKNFV